MKYILFRDDGIGDLIVSTMAINLIKKNDKYAKLLLVCSKRNYQYANILKEGLEINEYINLCFRNS